MKDSMTPTGIESEGERYLTRMSAEIMKSAPKAADAGMTNLLSDPIMLLTI